MGARGNSGVILSQILRGLAGTLKGATDLTATKVAEGVGGSVDCRVSGGAEADRGHDPHRGPRVRGRGRGCRGRRRRLVDVLRAARDAGKAALDSTPELLPVLKDAGVVDAGGAGYLLLLDAALHVVDGEPLPEPDDGRRTHRRSSSSGRAPPCRGRRVDVSELRYEVMYFLDLVDERIQAFKEAWGEIGDSIVVVGGDGLWNCHVHTNDIGAAIEAALDSRRPPEADPGHRSVRGGRRGARRARSGDARRRSMPDRRRIRGCRRSRARSSRCASGDGLAELFGQLGVQGVVTGGQTLNPSTAELLDAVEAVNADAGDRAAEQQEHHPRRRAGRRADRQDGGGRADARRCPRRSPRWSSTTPRPTPTTNGEEMTDGAESVATGEVTQAVRDTHERRRARSPTGDWIGIVRGDGIVAVSAIARSARPSALLDHLVTDGREIVTVDHGRRGQRRPTPTRCVAWLAEHRPDVQVEVHRGGQPLYPYLFGVE